MLAAIKFYTRVLRIDGKVEELLIETVRMRGGFLPTEWNNNRENWLTSLFSDQIAQNK